MAEVQVIYKKGKSFIEAIVNDGVTKYGKKPIAEVIEETGGELMTGVSTWVETPAGGADITDGFGFSSKCVEEAGNLPLAISLSRADKGGVEAFGFFCVTSASMGGSFGVFLRFTLSR